MTKTTGARPKTLVIHIGDHKTGTTTIQNALAADCVRIAGAKLLYPAKLNHNYLMGHITADKRGEPAPQAKPGQLGLAALSERIRNAAADYVVLSAEVFENVPAPRFKELVEQYFSSSADRIRIVAYVRPHAQRILSSYAEQIKIGWFRGSMQDFFEHNWESKRFHFASRFHKWSECFGEDFVLRPMIRKELESESVLADFAHVAFDGLPYEVDNFPSENQSLGLRELALLNFLQEQYQDKPKWLRHTLGWEIARRIGTLAQPGAVKPMKLAMDRALADRIALSYEMDARAVDDRFFDERPLLQEALVDMQGRAVSAPQSLTASDYFDDEQLRNLTILTELIHDMLDVKHPWPAYFHRHRIEDVRRFKARKTRSASLATDPVPADADAGRTGSEKD